MTVHQMKRLDAVIAHLSKEIADQEAVLGSINEKPAKRTAEVAED